MLNQCAVIKKQFSDIITVEIDYTSYGGLMNALAAAGYKPAAESFGEKVSLDFEIEVKKTEEFLALIRETTNGRFDYAVMEQRYVDLPFLN